METNEKKIIKLTPLAAVFMLLIWGVFTLLLALSIVGLIVLVIMTEETDNGKGWFNIPTKCVDTLNKQ
jgi:cytochrome c oxidase subunit IV